MLEQLSPTRDLAEWNSVGSSAGRRLRRFLKTRMVTFTEGLAHDVRTPLTVIQEYADLMREGLVGVTSEDHERALEVIADRACDLNRIVDNAVDASRLTAKSHRVWGRPCSVGGLISRISPPLQRKANLRKIALHIERSMDGPSVHCDDETVSRAITNILVAALNLCREGSRISITEDVETRLKEAGFRVRIESSQREAFAELIRQAADRRELSQEKLWDQFCDLRLAAELIDLNFGRLVVQPSGGSSTTLWIGLPLVEPVEILRRHLQRVSRGNRALHRLSLFEATVSEPFTPEMSRDIGNMLNSRIGRHDLAIALDANRWLLATGRKSIRTSVLRRRLEHSRDAINRKRLGRPLPEIAVKALGSWPMPEDLSEILGAVERWIERRVPAGTGVD